MPRQHPSSKMHKTEMIWKNISSLVHFMTFCPILITTAATAELVCPELCLDDILAKKFIKQE
jgi:Na+-translocating ferredoxin:NAD+ oxidoreductase RnfE subunit